MTLIGKLGKALRGGTGPAQMFLACLIGVLVGMVPGINLTLVLGILLLVLINVNGPLAVLGIVVGKVLCLLLAPVTFEIGYVLIHGIGLENLLCAACEVPVLPWADIHVYCLLGGIPVAIVAGTMTGIIALRVFKKARGAAAEEGGEKPDEQSDPKDWIIRKWGFTAVAAVIVIAAGLELFALDGICKRAATLALERTAGAEVNVAEANFSVFGGEFELKGLEITDPNKAACSIVRVEKLHGDINVKELLKRRVVIDKIEVVGVATDQPRRSPGKVYEKPAEEKPALAGDERPQDALARYVELDKDLQKYQLYVEKLKKYLKDRKAEIALEKAPDGRKKRLAARAADRGYLSLSAADLLAGRPAWTIREVIVDKIEVKRKYVEAPTRKRYGEGAKKKLPPKLDEYRIDARELSSDPRLNGKPMSVRVIGKDRSSGEVILNVHEENARHTIKLFMPAVPLSKAIYVSQEVPADVKGGKVNVTAEGFFDSESMRVLINLRANELKAQSREGRRVLGLEPEMAKEVLESLSQLSFNVIVEGPLDAPRLKVDQKQIADGLRNALVNANKLQLLNRMNEQLVFTQGALSGKFKEAVDVGLPGKVGDLLTGEKKPDKKDEPDDEQAKPEKKLPKQLDDLLEIP